MTKYQPYSRRVWRRRFGSWAYSNLGLIVGITTGVVVLIAAETVVFTVILTPTAFTWWLLGLVQATVVAIYLHMLHSAFLAHDREAIWHLRGAWGEDNTRSELQRAKRRRLIWGWVDSIDLQAGDLDHLVVTRRGGLVAIDSKWRNDANDTVDMAQAAHRVRLRAEGLARTVLKAERGARHRDKSNPLRVIPVVVLWGSAQHHVPDRAQINGINFVSGRRLLDWLRTLDGEPVDKLAAHDVIERLEEYRASVRSQAGLTDR
jgi:hypothetical protein